LGQNNAKPIKMKTSPNPILRSIVPPLLLLSLGFILCMHWFLLMADSLVSGITSEIVPPDVISTIMAYYTVVFGPMTWLVKLFILLMFVTTALQLFIREVPWFLKWPIFVINVPLIFQGVFRIIPMVGRFILNADTAETQSQMARTAHDAHVLSAYGTAALIVLQLIVVVLLMTSKDTPRK
jgi:hypothetical protein